MSTQKTSLRGKTTKTISIGQTTEGKKNVRGSKGLRGKGGAPDPRANKV